MDKIIAYFRTSKAELEKVSWPSRRDTLRYGALVVVSSIAAAAFFGALDFGLGKIVEVAINSRNGRAIAQPEATVPDVTPTSQPAIQVSPGTVEGVDSDGNTINLQVQPSSP